MNAALLRRHRCQRRLEIIALTLAFILIVALVCWGVADIRLLYAYFNATQKSTSPSWFSLSRCLSSGLATQTPAPVEAH